MAAATTAFLPAPIREHLREEPGERMFGDDLAYLERAFEANGESFDMRTRDGLFHTVLARFGYLRGYHGCRALSVDSYYKRGLLKLTRERLASLAFDVFDGSISIEEWNRRAATANLNTRDNHLYFATDPVDFIRTCGHYLIYGCESMSCLWRDAHGRADPRFLESQERQRSKGIPTLFACDVPIGWIPRELREELAKTLVTHFFQGESKEPLPERERSHDWCFWLRRDLPPRYIRQHSHPATIPDPLRMTTYRNPHLTCSHCTATTVPGTL